jgi:hypothetical protein
MITQRSIDDCAALAKRLESDCEEIAKRFPCNNVTIAQHFKAMAKRFHPVPNRLHCVLSTTQIDCKAIVGYFSALEERF